jgi:hypothetical protein
VNIIRAFVCVALALSSIRAGAQGRIAGTVFDSLSTRAPLANATVVLVERSRYATTDARGRFQIDSVPDGHYTMGFLHAVLDSFDLELPAVPVDVAGGRSVAVSLSTPSQATVYARICPGPHGTDTGVIMGRVRDVDENSPLADATVRTEWTEFTVTTDRVERGRARDAARTSRNGSYLMCGVPTRTQIDVDVDYDDFVAGPTPTRLGANLIARVDLALSLRDSAARADALGDSASVAPGAAGTASLRGTVLGADGRIMRDALVSVLGTRRSGRTDAAGAFKIDRIPAGTRTVEVQSIGWEPMTVAMDFSTNATRQTSLSIGRQAQTLAQVDVTRTAILPSLMERSGFEIRRHQGMGAFVTEQDIKKHTFSDFISVLEGMRGMHVTRARGLLFPYLIGISDFDQVRCIPNVFLDGAPFPISAPSPRGPIPDFGSFQQLSGILFPEAIKGIEVYSNPGTIPAQYDLTSSTGCGSILIWTH